MNGAFGETVFDETLFFIFDKTLFFIFDKTLFHEKSFDEKT
jgi:hypothetical protein